MLKRWPLIAFLALQVVIVGLYVSAILPLLQAGSTLTPSTDAQIWSGGAFSNTVGNFRSGSSASMAAPFKPFASLLWATCLIVGSAAAAGAASFLFRGNRVWLAVLAAVLSLALGAGGAWHVITQWSGDTLFPPGSFTIGWLYALTRSWILQFFIGFVLLAIGVVAAIAGLATPEKPQGFHLVALNWAIVAAVWSLSYLLLYAGPALTRAA
jgi:heme/copper-type cytochrome/quinol oxidase subunit 3